MIWSPIVCSGLNEVIGSWKIMPICFPRMLAHLAAAGWQRQGR